MIGGQIQYRPGYKYQLRKDWSIQTKIKGQPCNVDGFITLDADGILTIHKGYAWDGGSFIAVDSRNAMRGYLGHDAGYSLLRAGKLPPECKKDVDQLLYDLLREDGVTWIRAKWIHAAVSKFAGFAARQQCDRDQLAP